MDTMGLKYKYRDMKIYSSDEWMAGSTKKYRKVFDRYETTYLRTEISFFNKLFDEEEWEASFRSKCFFVSGSQKNELSNFEEKRKVLKDENIVFIRHSWGNATPGAYWRKGNYVWEAYIDEVKVGEAFFYVEDLGQAVAGENLYFDIDSIKMFEGDAQGSSQSQKKYIKKFNQKETRYVWGEFNFRNKAAKDYYAELVFIFSDSDGQHKGTHNYLVYVQPNTVGQVYTAYASWGNNVTGSWNNDSYILEVVFLDTRIATVPFEVRDAVEEGPVDVLTGSEQVKVQTRSST